MVSDEVWRSIKNYEGFYKVSNLGRVRSLKRFKCTGRILKFRNNKYGYPYVGLSKKNIKKTIAIHKLVGEAFLKKITGKPFVDHKDTDKTNNHISNLRRSNISLNGANAKKRKDGKSQYKGVSFSEEKKLWFTQLRVNKIKYWKGYFKQELQAALTYDDLAIKHFGEYARTNQMLGLL